MEPPEYSSTLRSPAHPCPPSTDLLLFDLGAVERGDLGEHQPVLGDVSVGPTIRLCEKAGLCHPLHVDRVAHWKAVLGLELEATQSALADRFDKALEESADRISALDHLTPWEEELRLRRVLRHQPLPIACVDGCQMFVHDRLRGLESPQSRQRGFLGGGRGCRTRRRLSGPRLARGWLVRSERHRRDRSDQQNCRKNLRMAAQIVGLHPEHSSFHVPIRLRGPPREHHWGSLHYRPARHRRVEHTSDTHTPIHAGFEESARGSADSTRRRSTSIHPCRRLLRSCWVLRRADRSSRYPYDWVSRVSQASHISALDRTRFQGNVRNVQSFRRGAG